MHSLAITGDALRFLACFILCVSLGACRDAPAAPAELRIGVISDFTPENEGTAVKAARSILSACDAKDVLKAEGRDHRVVLHVAYAENDPEGALRAAKHLIDTEKVHVIIGPSMSRNALPVAELVHMRPIAMISPASTSPETTENKPNVFRIAAVDFLQARALALLAREDLQVMSAAVLYERGDAYSQRMANTFRYTFEEQGRRVLAYEGYESGTKDFHQQLTKIRALDPDVLFLPNYHDDVLVQAKQARGLGIRATLLGADGWDPGKVGAFTQMDGAYFSHHWHPDMGARHADGQRFDACYRSHYGTAPTAMAALTRDAFALVFKAFQDAGITNQYALRERIAATKDFVGITGTLSYEGGGDPKRAIAILRVASGTVELYKLME